MNTTSGRLSVLGAALCMALWGCVDPEDEEELELELEEEEDEEDEEDVEAHGLGLAAPGDPNELPPEGWEPPSCPTSCLSGSRCFFVDPEGNEAIWNGHTVGYRGMMQDGFNGKWCSHTEYFGTNGSYLTTSAPCWLSDVICAPECY